MDEPRSGRMPGGNDPRLGMDVDALSAASISALPEVGRRPGFDAGLIAGTLGIIALGALVWASLDTHPAPPPPPAQITPRPYAPPSPSELPQASVLPPIDLSLNSPVEQPLPPSAPVAQPQTFQPQPVPVSPQPDSAGLRATSLVIDNSVSAQGAGSQLIAGGVGNPLSLSVNDQFAMRANADATQRAERIGDMSRVVPQGTVIPAVLETAINSDLPGYTRAVVSRDIRSYDGSQILVPRGSRLIGQYKSGLTSGETRAFVIWTRLLRPDGLSVQLASPGIDQLGQAGMEGRVDDHFAKRFGAAILLSVVNGVAGGLQGSGNGSAIVIGTSTDAQNVATEALSNDVKIPPTIKVRQGASIQVFAARDLDFGAGK